jgi:hypothetical protein
MTSNGWDGVCVCGKEAMDGVRCRFGASHSTLERRPRVRERLDDPPPRRKRERLDLFDIDDD